MGIGRACNANDFNAWISAVILCLQFHVQGAVSSIHVQNIRKYWALNILQVLRVSVRVPVLSKTLCKETRLAFVSGEAVCG